jgi:hypothetical protein
MATSQTEESGLSLSKLVSPQDALRQKLEARPWMLEEKRVSSFYDKHRYEHRQP